MSDSKPKQQAENPDQLRLKKILASALTRYRELKQVEQENADIIEPKA
jgi:hypothetical protein